MAECIVKERRATDAPSLAIGGRFKGFNPEAERSSSRADVKENRTIAELKRVWDAVTLGYFYYCEGYDRFNRMLRDIRYSAEDVELFSLALAGSQDLPAFPERAGIFLSALINNGDEEEFRVRIIYDINYLGYTNRKIIHVSGYSGHNLGYGMQTGSITVDGDCGDCLGNFMAGGTITVKGDAGGNVAMRMSGGSISIYGSYELSFTAFYDRETTRVRSGSPGTTIIAEPGKLTIIEGCPHP